MKAIITVKLPRNPNHNPKNKITTIAKTISHLLPELDFFCKGESRSAGEISEGT